MRAGGERHRAGRIAAGRDIGVDPARLEGAVEVACLADAAAGGCEMHHAQARVVLHQGTEIARQPVFEAANDLRLRAAAHGSEAIIGNAGVAEKGHAVDLRERRTARSHEPGDDRQCADEYVGLREPRPYGPLAQ